MNLLQRQLEDPVRFNQVKRWFYIGLAAVAAPTGAAAKNAGMWSKDPDVAAADFATGNLYALYWLLAQARPTPTEQANTFARFAIFVQGKAWIGTRCLDITKVALVIGAPPRIENCK